MECEGDQDIAEPAEASPGSDRGFWEQLAALHLQASWPLIWSASSHHQGLLSAASCTHAASLSSVAGSTATRQIARPPEPEPLHVYCRDSGDVHVPTCHSQFS